jgi:transcriptional regulator with XRE-family HTH domain
MMTIEDEVQRFAMNLRRARRNAGDVPYRELAKETNYSISSISRILNGKNFPRWPFTEKFLRICKISEAQIDGAWRRRWLEIAELMSPLGDDGQDDAELIGHVLPEPPGQECSECGALVLNPLRHRAWHAAYVRRDRIKAGVLRPVAAGPGGAIRSLSG